MTSIYCANLTHINDIIYNYLALQNVTVIDLLASACCLINSLPRFLSLGFHCWTIILSQVLSIILAHCCTILTHGYFFC